jgi:hemolysin-activating ACP:hemolysin acyltransferase
MTLYTLEELNRVLDLPSDKATLLHQTLGLMLPRLTRQTLTGIHAVGWHIGQLRDAFAEGRVEVYFDAFGRIAGSLIWKRLDEAGEAALLAGAEAVELSGSASGEAWIADFNVQHAALRALLQRAVAGGPLSSLVDIAYARMRRGWRTAKRIRVPVRPGLASAPSTSASAFLASGGGGQLRGEALEMLHDARRLGEWLMLISANPVHAGRQPDELLAALVTPIRLGQYVEVCGPDGTAKAFLSYGLLSEDGLTRLQQQGATALCPACFSEGDVLAATCAGAAPSSEAQSALAERAAALHAGLRRVLTRTGVAALDAV